MVDRLWERKSITKVDKKIWHELRDAFVSLNTKFRFPGDRDDKPYVGGVSYWFKQDEIHQATHVHGGPAFLPWHRELCNRFEKLLRMANPSISLHYWDWNEDSDILFTSDFMGESIGDAGEPWLSTGFYVPDPIGDNYRGLEAFDPDHSNPYDPPISLTRNKQSRPFSEYAPYTDSDIIKSETFPEMRYKLEQVHNTAHGYIGGTLNNSHTSFRDPFVFLIHSNVDRIFAAWQLRKGFEWRLQPAEVYGKDERNSIALGSTSPYVMVGIKTMLSPWCGVGYPYDSAVSSSKGEVEEPGVKDVRPWTYPENWHRDPNRFPDEKPKNSLDLSVVRPQPQHRYDKFPDGFEYNYDMVKN
jgi:Common central domain of tyrosinase